MRALAYPLALLLLVGTPAIAVAAGAGVLRWGQWVLGAGGGWQRASGGWRRAGGGSRRAGVVGIAGLVLTAGCAVNLLVPRTCAPGESNRPAISLVLGEGDCFAEALGQAQLGVLAGLLTSLGVTRLRR